MTPKELWLDEERKKRLQAKIDAAKAASPTYTGPKDADEADLRNDWDRFTDVAKVAFPEHLAAKFSLHGDQRKCAIAHCLGWSQQKISKASGYCVNTVGKWYQLEQFKEFCDAFMFHTGKKDAKLLIEKEQYATIQVLKDLRDDPTIGAATRADVAKWFYEQKHGKAKESREISGVNVRELTEQLMKMRKAADERTVVPDFGEDDKEAEKRGLLPKMGLS
jgi:hypothetical protein